MKNVKIFFKPSSKDPEVGNPVYVVKTSETVITINTSYLILAGEWCPTIMSIKTADNAEREKTLEGIRADIKWETRLLNRLVSEAQTCDIDIEKCFRSATSLPLGIFTFMRGQIKRQRDLGHVRLAEICDSTLNSLMNYLGYRDRRIDSLDSDFVLGYETYLRGRGLCRNTTSYYLRALRSAYTRAVRTALTPDRHPFDEAYTGVDTTVKRAISVDEIRRLAHLDLRNKPKLEYARDMFMLSFYLQGISFVDMAHLRKADLCNGVVTYRRRKTGQLMQVAWTGEMQEILERHPSRNHYLLPVIRNADKGERRQYLNEMTYINRNLKCVGAMARIGTPLTTYVSRHSWASTAQLLDVPLGVISRGLGHDSEKTTRIYLSNIRRSAVDAANRLVINSVVN